MKRIKYLWSLVALPLLMQGCTEIDQTDVGGLVPISLTAVVEDDANAGTRAATNLLNSFNDEELGLNLTNCVNSSGAALATTIYTVGGTFESQPYILAGQTATIHAFYPSSAKLVSSFSVSTDQSGNDGYKASDLMYATASVQKSSPTANLSFTHKMSKILVTANKGEGITNIQSIRIVGGNKTVALSGDDATLGATSSPLTTANYITMWSGTSTSNVSCAALIPPQTIGTANSAVNFLQIVTDKGTATYSLSGKEFVTGQSYQFTITVNAAAIGTNIDITGWGSTGNATVNPTVYNYKYLKIGDILYSDGSFTSTYDATHGEPIALVFSTTPTADDCARGYTHGYAMSLKIAHDKELCRWTNDGRLMHTVINGNNLETEDPATAWATISTDMDGLTNCLNAIQYCIDNNIDPDCLTAIMWANNYSVDLSNFVNQSGWYLPSIGQIYQWLVQFAKSWNGYEDNMCTMGTETNDAGWHFRTDAWNHDLFIQKEQDSENKAATNIAAAINSFALSKLGTAYSEYWDEFAIYTNGGSYWTSSQRMDPRNNVSKAFRLQINNDENVYLAGHVNVYYEEDTPSTFVRPVIAF